MTECSSLLRGRCSLTAFCTTNLGCSPSPIEIACLKPPTTCSTSNAFSRSVLAYSSAISFSSKHGSRLTLIVFITSDCPSAPSPKVTPCSSSTIPSSAPLAPYTLSSSHFRRSVLLLRSFRAVARAEACDCAWTAVKCRRRSEINGGMNDVFLVSLPLAGVDRSLLHY
jgi:hypothetical protein